VDAVLNQMDSEGPMKPKCLEVQWVVNGEVKEYIIQEDVEQAIQCECEVRFLLAHSAPIMKTLLRDRLRYLSDEALARLIILGTYNIPSDMDPATKLILEEIGKLGVKLVNGERHDIIITPEDLKRFWQKVNKFTLLSMSGVHYGHYKAAIQDETSLEVLALQLTVIAQSSIPPENRSVGLQVMLKKIAGVCLVEKCTPFSSTRQTSIAIINSSLASRQCKLSRKVDTSRKSYSAKKAALLRKQN
jgi:hypothetical protein